MHPFPLVDVSTKQFGPGLRGNSPGLCPVFIKNITRNSSQFLRKKAQHFPTIKGLQHKTGMPTNVILGWIGFCLRLKAAKRKQILKELGDLQQSLTFLTI